MSAKSSYKQILKSTGIIGGSQVITVLIGIARTKIVAVLLGPTGVGILGIFYSTIDIIRTGTGLGIDFSAIRDVAEAYGSDDEAQMSKTLTILGRWVWITGLLGMLVTIMFSRQLSQYAFGDETYSLGIAALSITLLTSAISGGKKAVLHGFRKIGTMATVNVLGVVFGFFISVPLYFLYGIDGIVPALILNSLVALTLSWWFARKIQYRKVKVSLKDTWHEGVGMVKLGAFGVVTGLIGTVIMYQVRVFISGEAGLEAVGYFQASWTVSSVYLEMILGAMWADFFPRLSAVNNDNKAVTRLLNEQIEVVVMIAAPMIIGMISFIPILVTLLYSSKFYNAIGILQWQLMGDFLKVIVWPMSFVILAKARGFLYVISESFWDILFITIIYIGWGTFGIEVAGISFFVSYVVGLLILNIISVYMVGFKWSLKNIRNILMYFFLVLCAFLSAKFFPPVIAYGVGAILLIISLYISYSGLKGIIDVKDLINKIFKK